MFQISAIKTALTQFSWGYKIALQAGLIIGFIFLSDYFISIEYFPVNDLSSFASILLYEALLCFIIFGCLAYTLSIAPYFWIKAVLGSVKTCDWIVGRNALEPICNIANQKPTNQKFPGSTYFRLYIAYTMPTLMYSSLLFYFWKNNLTITCLLFVTGSICFKISFFIFPSLQHNYSEIFHTQIATQQQTVKNSFCHVKSNFVNFISTIAASFFSGSCVFLSILILLFFTKAESSTTQFLLIATVSLFSGGCFLLNEPHQNIKAAIFASSVLTILMILPNSIKNIEAANMHKAGLGAFDATLEVDHIVCEILAKNKLEINCQNNQTSHSANNIHILWRGNEYYIRFIDKELKTHYLIIPSSHIFGYDVRKTAKNMRH